ncbi:hypothetical protein LAZ67_1005939, partial [Cordylochernes scorpioides]
MPKSEVKIRHKFNFIIQEIKDLESENKAIVESKNIHGLKLFQQEVNERKISLNQVINTLLESELDDTQYDDYSRAKKDIFNMLVSIEEALSLIETKENTHSDKQLPESNVNLPKINLPIFNGDSANWLSFREIFNSTINSNQTLTEIQKFQYLNASVKGPAEKLIRGFPISDKNYQQAWDTLCNRFNNKRELAFSQINKIFSIRPLKSISAGSLYEILDVCNEGIRNLSVLGLEKNTLTDLILINFFEKRIGEALRKEWELTLQNEEYPTFENFVNFLEKHARSLQGMRIPLFQEQKTSSKNMMAHGLYVNKGQNCILCHQIHKLNDCHRFINLPLPKKWELVKKHKLCQNCLRANHEISKCRITSRCKNCKQNHHTLLHEYNSEPSIPQPTTSQEMLISTNTICNAMPLETETNILLSTALIKVKAKDGSFVLCRALVDNGSQISLISEQCCHKLGLEKRKNSYTLKGVGDIVVNRTTSQVEIEFTPHHNDQLFSARAFVVGRVTADLPNFQIQSADFPHLENLLLADPEFYVTKPIDLILGADTFVEIILGQKTDLKHHPIALNTKLGWLVSGRIHSNIKSNTSVINHCTTELDSSIRKFWELEDVPISKAQLGTKKACEILFKSNLQRDIEGRYSVNLPFKSTPNLGDSRSQALEKGLQDNPSKSEEIPSKSKKSRISKLTPQITSKQNQLLPSESSQPSTPEQPLASQSSEPLSSKKETSIIPKIKPPPYYRRKRQLPAEKTSWDEPIESDIKSNWNKFQTQLSCLKEIKIPRYLNSSSSEIEELQLHGFCDASLNAYSAVFYLKTRFKNQKIKINLITSKTKVAPLKIITIPRLELSAALLLAQLNQVILESFPFQPDKTFLWTDSQICIDWIRSDASRWKAFVSNRVSSIQNLTQITDWFHVSSQDNPADCASRGIMPQDLVNHRIWWRGPIWLQENNVRYIPSSSTQVNLNIIQEVGEGQVLDQTTLIQNSETMLNLEFIERYSTMTKLIRITAWCWRFYYNCLLFDPIRQKGPLTTRELTKAIQVLVKSIQQVEFCTEIKLLKLNKQLPLSNKLTSLNPFLDTQGLLRVGGRLKYSYLNENQKFPLLLPKNHHITNLIIDNIHRKYLHAGPQLVLSILRKNYWILGARDAVKKIIKKCLICLKFKSTTIHQIMGNLPPERIIPSRPFSKTGIDLTGPFLIKRSLGRSKTISKSYIVLFICFTTKAIHLELTTSLSTDSFMASLRRFMARRGKPSDIYSDNATNFKGASNFFRTQFQLLNSQSVQRLVTEELITWHFIPPGGPHFGGLWEAGIKSVKSHLVRTFKSTILNYEEMNTLIIQIESCLNSRPLAPLSSDPNDYEALTPAHFLIGSSFSEIPTSNSEVLNLQTRWKLIQNLKNSFWSRWSKEYLSNLQGRGKWRIKQDNIQIGQLVYLKEAQISPLRWPLARIQEIFPGEDKNVREIKDLESRNKSIVESKNIHRLKLFQQEVNERKISLNQIVNTLLESELDETQYEDYSKAKDDIFNMLVSIEEALSLIETKENTHSDKQLPESNVNLPKINLPIFNGDSANWLSFREIFNSTINSNQTLTEIQKFQYLNASVKGPAEKLIRGFPFSDRNYQQAWDTLCNRFNNRRELAFSQINKIFSIRPLKSITTGSLYEILDVCNEGIRNLSVLGLENNTLTDLILINFFEKRIGEALRKEWELTLQNEEYPTFENFVKFLEKHARSLQGVGDIVVNRTTSQVEIEFTPHHNDQLFSARAFVVGRVTADLPNFQIQSADFPHLENLLLADPEFYVTKPIDLILGADTFVEIILGHKTDLKHHPIALNTNIRKFWELEDVPISKAQLGTKNACEILFKSNLKRDIEGRYSVNLPFKSTPNLGDSRSQALRRFFNLEKRLQANPSLKSQYINFMREYMELNHMELIPLKELKKPSNQCFYLPHHGVLREQSTTTKIRVVFDASSRSTNNLSLNDFLHVGPKLQQNLFNILLRFRTFPIAITADIEKMFRQIRLNSDDRDYHRILWRENPEDPLLEYRLLTVTYGTASAPFLAIRTIQQLAEDESSKFPSASSIVFRDFYVDDLISGAYSIQEAKSLVAELSSLLNKEFIERYSTMTKLIRITAWCWRFYYNCLLFDPIRQKGPLTTRELTKAIQVLVKSIQQVEFCTEIKLLKSNKQLPLSNKLTSLNPFLDTQGLLRVGGRLKYSYLNENQKFPLLLPKNHHITNLIIDDIHRKYLHAGPQLVLSILRKNYWILGARDAVKKIIKKCLICLKFKSTTIHQIMGNLPPERIIPSRPFSKTGIDLTGPFLIKRSLGRSKTISKSYIVLFICFTTKAIHLELTTSLSTDSFMASLRRFMARRGKPSDIYSDNATNFKGASNFFRTQFQLLNSQSVQRLVTEELITWHFIPPAGPHFGGLWEAGIKSVKSHLVRTFKSTTLNYEEMNTLIIQIESCLNSRPLAPLSSDPNDYEALTPAHFLIGSSFSEIPTSNSEVLNLQTRWKLIQKLKNSFWSRWSKEYLSNLQGRGKWRIKQDNIQLGQLVYLKEAQISPLHWPLARIQEIFPGEDKNVR